MLINFKNNIRCDELEIEIGKLPPLTNLQTKLKPEGSSIIALSRVLSNKLQWLQMSTQSYIRLRQLIPVAVKLVK